MKILILTVNYNSHKDVHNFFISLLKAQSNMSNLIIDLVIFDNSIELSDELNKLKYNSDFISSNSTIKIVKSQTNSGYFGGLELFKSYTNNAFYNYSIYCNPDIVFDEFFFSELIQCKDSGIISPALISVENGTNQNPMLIHRVSGYKLLFMKFCFSYRRLYAFYNFLANLKHEYFNKIYKDFSGDRIYATQGSIFIFSDNDFIKNIPLYSCFLFGEELFIAEEAVKHDIVTYYRPKIIVHNISHSALRYENSEFKRKHELDSIKFLLNMYF